MVRLVETQFDVYTTEMGEVIPIKAFTWDNQQKVSVQVITYGATITSIRVPGKTGQIEDIVTGFTNLAGYRSSSNPYFGATVGRVANRIAFGQFKILKNVISVSKNHGKHQLHGGFVGFDKVVWEYCVKANKVVMSYHSSDMEEGYPGDLVVHAIFELSSQSEFRIEFKATTTKPTYVNMTNHSYFNLAGHHAGATELYRHAVCINADRITEANNECLPTGRVLPVAESVFDLRIPQFLGDVINEVPNCAGFDHNFCITKGSEQGRSFIAKVYHPESGRVLEVYSNQPGVHFYTSNCLPENPEFSNDKKSETNVLSGKGTKYYKHAAFCLETQNWPDAPNHANFPRAILLPGETYYHYIIYKFSVKK